MTITLRARPLDVEALAPYAVVLAAPDGKTRLIPEVLAIGDVPGAHAFTILCPQPATAPATITSLERHPHSTQTFLPLRVRRWLVLIAPTAPDGRPDLAAAQAFLAGPDHAVCIRQNVWHAGLTVFDQPAQFGMIMWKAGNGEDGIVHELGEGERDIRVEM